MKAHAQKPDFVFRQNGRVHLNRRGLHFSRILAVEVCASAVIMLDTPCYEVVWNTGYPLHSPVSPSLPLPCVTVYHHISTGVYNRLPVDEPSGSKHVEDTIKIKLFVYKRCVLFIFYTYIVTAGRCVGLTTLPPSCADCLEIRETQLPGTLRACPGP